MRSHEACIWFHVLWRQGTEYFEHRQRVTRGCGSAIGKRAIGERRKRLGQDDRELTALVGVGEERDLFLTGLEFLNRDCVALLVQIRFASFGAIQGFGTAARAKNPNA